MKLGSSLSSNRAVLPALGQAPPPQAETLSCADSAVIAGELTEVETPKWVALPSSSSGPLARLPGQAAIRQELGKLVDDLAQGKAPTASSFLLQGNSGSGKSTLVQALQDQAQSQGVACLSFNSADLLGGEAGSKIREAFAQAESLAGQGRSLLVLDDVDVLAPVRRADGKASDHAHLMTLTRLLKSSPKVVVVATTSERSSMDLEATEALQRHLVLVDPANASERRAIIDYAVRENGWSAEPQALAQMAEATPGMLPGKLLRILRAAASSPQGITAQSALHARLNEKFGAVKPLPADYTEWMLRMTVGHELGHVVVRHFFQQMAQRPDQMPQAIDAVSFVPRQSSTADVFLKPVQGNPTVTFETLFADAASNLAGREAERLLHDGHTSIGPAGDISFATAGIQKAVRVQGMGKRSGPFNPTANDNKLQLSLADQDEHDLLQATQSVAASLVKFYQPFLESFGLQMAQHMHSPERLVIDGKELLAQVSDWEKADPKRHQALGRMMTWARQKMEDLKPKPVEVFDPYQASS